MATLRVGLDAVKASDARLKDATDAAAKADQALADARDDDAAKNVAFSVDLKKRGGKAVDPRPEADGTLTEYVSDASDRGWHAIPVPTLDFDDDPSGGPSGGDPTPIVPSGPDNPADASPDASPEGPHPDPLA
jgi:hypothetical protein